MKFSLISGLAVLANVVSAADLPAIEIVGNKFFFSNNGSQFYIKGVAYQSNSLVNTTSKTTFHDPLADVNSCKRDIPYLKKLGTNVIRVYAIDSTLDHSVCMKALNDAGIYVISDLSEPGLSINRDDPKWTVELLARYASVVDSLSPYSNVLGFFAGNEVINAPNNTDSAPFVKAAIRDTKAYIKQKGYRNIPVGYSASDDAKVRVPEANYFACGSADEHADFYGVNMYEWCGESSFKKSGYEARTEEMKNMTIPLFFSEYGCNEVQPRKFQEVATLFSSEMTDVWSGGIVYMYFEEENNYGLVTVEGSTVKTLADFGYYSSAIAKISPTSVNKDSVSTSTSVIGCPATSQNNWVAATNLPPTPNADVCDCLSDSAACSINDDIDEKKYGKLFGYLCGVISCNAISGNGTTGEFGAFSGCSPKQQLDYVMNAYYEKYDKKASNCDFSGSAQLKGGVKTASTCAAYFKAAGTAGTGSLNVGSSVNVGSSKPTGSHSNGQSNSNSNSNASDSKSDSKGKKGKKSKNAAAPQSKVGVAAAVLGGLASLLFSIL